MTIKREIWGHDPAWFRCEAFDPASDESLGQVWFEPNPSHVSSRRVVTGLPRLRPFAFVAATGLLVAALAIEFTVLVAFN